MSPFGRLAALMVAAIVVVAAGWTAWTTFTARSDGTGIAVDVAAEGAPAGDEPVATAEVIVSAASSLTDAFTAIAAAFEDEQPGVEVVLNLGGSSALAEQIRAGAPADVFVSADPALVDDLAALGLLDDDPTPAVIARNRLQLAVPADSTAVTGLADLRDTDLLVGLCAATVPCGAYARESLAAAGLDPDALADTLEPDVRALLTKLRAGELDAAIVYATDVRAAASEVVGTDIEGPAVSYPIAIVRDAANLVVAQEFVAFVRSGEGQALLRAEGFAAP